MLMDLRGFMTTIKSPNELYQTRETNNIKRTLLFLFKI